MLPVAVSVRHECDVSAPFGLDIQNKAYELLKTTCPNPKIVLDESLKYGVNVVDDDDKNMDQVTETMERDLLSNDLDFAIKWIKKLMQVWNLDMNDGKVLRLALRVLIRAANLCTINLGGGLFTYVLYETVVSSGFNIDDIFKALFDLPATYGLRLDWGLMFSSLCLDYYKYQTHAQDVLVHFIDYMTDHDLNKRYGGHGFTALHSALYYTGSFFLVSKLLKRVNDDGTGLDICNRDNYNNLAESCLIRNLSGELKSEFKQTYARLKHYAKSVPEILAHTMVNNLPLQDLQKIILQYLIRYIV